MIPLPKLEIGQTVTFLSFAELKKINPYKHAYSYGGRELPNIKGVVTYIEYNQRQDIYIVTIKFLTSDYINLYPTDNVVSSKYMCYKMLENEFKEYYEE